MKTYDFVVLGSGPAGRRAAVQAAKLGKSVLVVDNRARLGGVSVHTGTIPSKTLRETILNLTGWRERSFYGRSYRVKQDISADDLGHRLDKTLCHEVDVLEHQFARNGVKTIFGQASFAGPHTIKITGVAHGRYYEEMVKAGTILIAVGTHPHRPSDIPFDNQAILDSDDFIAHPHVPRSLAVIGAGVIGLEYATIFSALDVAVTVIEPRETMLDFMDQEIVDHLVHQLRDRGVQFRMGSVVDRVTLGADGHPICWLADGRQVRSETLLYAAGRMGSTDNLNLGACGLTVDGRGRLSVDPATYQTAVPHIYAAGDVIGFPSLASTSMDQGRMAACHAFAQSKCNVGQHYPLGIYTVPEMSSVGHSEQEVRKRGIAYECGIARFRETSRGHIMGIEAGLLKLVVALDTRKVLGVHIIGEGATELVHIGQAVINLGGTIDYFIDNTFNFPTLAEAYKVAALDAWNRMQALTGALVALPRRASGI